MDTPLAIIGFVIGAVSLLVSTAALFVSINIYNATGDYKDIKRYRLRKALRYYLRRSTKPKDTKMHEVRGGWLRAWWISYWLLLCPNRIKPVIDKLQVREQKRMNKGKRYSSPLAGYGFAGIIRFARNDMNDIFDNIDYKTIQTYIGKGDYEKLIAYIKMNFIVHGKIIEKDITNTIISQLFWGIDETKKELAGALLYLFWYRLEVLKLPLPITLTNLDLVIEKLDNKEFYDYFTEEYSKNINELHSRENELGSGHFAMYDNRDNRIVEFLMLVKYAHFAHSVKDGHEMRLYIEGKNKNTHQSIMESVSKVFKEQLELVGGTADMERYILEYIKRHTTHEL